MRETDFPAFALTAQQLADALHVGLEASTIEATFDALRPYGLALVTAAVPALLREARWFPRPAEWRTAIDQLTVNRPFPRVVCPVCQGRGLVRVGYEGESAEECDVALCVCPAGVWYRQDGRGRPTRWHAWAARAHVDAARICLLEEIYTDAELATWGVSRSAA